MMSLLTNPNADVIKVQDQEIAYSE